METRFEIFWRCAHGTVGLDPLLLLAKEDPESISQTLSEPPERDLRPSAPLWYYFVHETRTSRNGRLLGQFGIVSTRKEHSQQKDAAEWVIHI